MLLKDETGKNMTDLNKEIIILWNKGLTSGQVSDALGITRNAVMGRINRMRRRGIELRSIDTEMVKKIREKEEAKERERQEKKRLYKLFKIKKPRYVENVSDSVTVKKPSRHMPGVTILQLRISSCRYIISEHADENAVYCGMYTQNRPYCPEHAALCYLPRQKPKRDVKIKVMKPW